MKTRLARLCLVLGLAIPAAAGFAREAPAIGLIRDAEIENSIRMFGAPLFAMAGLDARSVRVFIVRDQNINAFVAGGQNIFINTGLLTASQSANEVVGVIAHETGHIVGGHLSRAHEAMSRANWQTILSLVLGAAAAVAGSPEAAGAIISGGQNVAQRNYLHYSRSQESAADQAAFRFLDATGQSVAGMLAFFELLGDQEALLTANQDPYVRTHPLFSDRIEAARQHLAKSPYAGTPDKPAYQEAHARMRAKLIGFLNPPEQTLREYPPSDISIPATYGRAVAYHKAHRLEKSLAEMASLLNRRPDDPYFHELRGQILLESGRIDEAIPSYRAALRVLGDEPQILVGLGQALVAEEKPEDLEEAVEVLRRATQFDPGLTSAWRWLAVAYGRMDNIGMASLATAERYMLIGRPRDAAGQARRAEHHLAAGSPGHLRAQDIISLVRQRKK